MCRCFIENYEWPTINKTPVARRRYNTKRKFCLFINKFNQSVVLCEYQVTVSSAEAQKFIFLAKVTWLVKYLFSAGKLIFHRLRVRLQ